ncbi:MAG: F0F1 ATP synthase subunit epsilon [Bacteroidetes bacterium]|nr:F0F1 ATP synthase subunit epsilon [Bacteroidota bacterium]
MSDEKNIKLEIITPNKVVFSKEVNSVTLPGEAGSFQVLFNHAPLLSNLTIGQIKIQNVDDTIEYYAASGGFAVVLENVVTVLSETTERSNSIDVKRAEAALDRAKKRIAEKAPDLDYERAFIAMERAKNRLRISQK